MCNPELVDEINSAMRDVMGAHNYMIQQINDVEAVTLTKLQVEQQGMFTFNHFPLGSFVSIDLVPEEFEGVAMEPAQTINGFLMDNKRSRIFVANASGQPDIVGKQIYLGTDRFFNSPAGQVFATARCVSPRESMAYYFPEDIDPEGIDKLPVDYRHVAAKYARLRVNGNDVFDMR